MNTGRISKWLALGTLGLAALLTGSRVAAGTSPAKIEGVLIDEKCSANAQTRIVSEGATHLEGGIVWAYTHTRKCALMPDCQRSGYGVATHDNRFLKFDAEGNRKAAEMLRVAKKEDDLEVEVTGEVQGDHIKITSLTWQ
jgi:hypothetical protein